MAPTSLSIELAKFPDDEEHVMKLLIEYRDSSPHDICFRSFDDELDEISLRYAAPAGGMLLASNRNELAGCIGWWRCDDAECEMRRLFVRPAYRGQGLGRQLIDAFLLQAKSLGFQSAVWHSLPAMQSAIRLYHAMGFNAIESNLDVNQPVYFRCLLDKVAPS